MKVSRLAWCEYARTPTANDRFAPGDILIVWNLPQGQDGHVWVVMQDWRVEFGEDVVETANYGAPGGAIRTSAIGYRKAADGRKIAILNKRRIQRWVPLYPLLKGAKAVGRLGDAQDPTRDGEGVVQGAAE